MQTIKVRLSKKELILLTDALNDRWGLKYLQEKPESLAAKLTFKLYDAKLQINKNNN